MSDIKVPEGYKQTEIGVIPEDWDLLSVREICDLLTGFPFPSSKYQDSGIRLLRGSNVKRGNTDWDENITRFWSESTSGIEQYLLQKDDVVISMDGSLVGRSFAQLSDSDLPSLLLQRVARLRARVVSQNYLKEWICSPIFSDYCDSVKTVTAIPHISPADILNFRLLIPKNKKEQTAIATALSDVDNLIQSLEKLIAKKEAIKTGTMQQLLTGKTRLPEFATRDDGSPKGFKQTELGRIPEDWDYKTLSEMTENKGLVRGPFGGALKKDSFVRTGFKVYEQRNAIYANTEIGKYYIDKDKFNELQRFTVKPKDFIVSCSGTIGRIYQIPVNAPEGIINQALLKITLNKNTDEHFFYQIFNSKEFQESITDSTQGGAMKNLIGMSEFKKSIMLMPSKPEQTAIATILSDMDVEIQALQQRLEKTRDIKQGMMQQLLTGKVRLAH